MNTSSAFSSNQPQSDSAPNQGRESGPDTSSILILEVKSVPNDVNPCPDNGLRKRLIRAAEHVKETREFARYVAPRDSKRSEKLSTCAGLLMLNQYLKTGDCRVSGGIFCQQPLLCGFCASGRAGRQSIAMGEKIDLVLSQMPHHRPYMFTLTMRGQKELAPMFQKFWKAWSVMVQRRANAKKGKTNSVMGLFDGGFLASEVKRGEAGDWHVHGHGIILADFPTYAEHRERLTREWATVVGQSWASTQFEPIEGNLSDAMREVIKYSAKWQPGNHVDRYETFKVLQGVKCVRAFGVLRGVKNTDEVTDDLSDVEGEDFIKRMFVYTRGSYQEKELPRREEAFDEWNEGR